MSGSRASARSDRRPPSLSSSLPAFLFIRSLAPRAISHAVCLLLHLTLPRSPRLVSLSTPHHVPHDPIHVHLSHPPLSPHHGQSCRLCVRRDVRTIPAHAHDPHKGQSPPRPGGVLCQARQNRYADLPPSAASAFPYSVRYCKGKGSFGEVYKGSAIISAVGASHSRVHYSPATTSVPRKRWL